MKNNKMLITHQTVLIAVVISFVFLFSACELIKEPSTCTVTFVTNNGSNVASQKVTDGEKAVRPENPSKTGFGFAGWYSDEACTVEYDFDTPVTEDVNLFVKWDINFYTVKFISSGSNIPDQNIAHNYTVNRPVDPTYLSGYTFGGWYRDTAYTAKYDFDTPVTANITLYAQWLRNYTVSFNANGGSPSPASQTIASGGKVNDPGVITKAENRLVGWYREAGFINQWDFDRDVVTANITIYAKWEREGITSIAAIGAYLAGQPGGGSADNPVNLTVNVQLTEANWLALLNAIHTAGKYINLDLSLCAASTATSGGGLPRRYWGNSFDAMPEVAAGKDKIISLILPDAADGELGYFHTSWNPMDPNFDYFSNLVFVSAANITNVAQEVFKGRTSLKRAEFPAAIYFGEEAFEGCTGLTSVTFSGKCNFLTGAFIGCTSLTSFSLIGTGNWVTVIEGGKALVTGGTKLAAYPSASGNITINTVTEIDAFAFKDCTNLIGMNFPQVTYIGGSAFEGCTSLVSVSFPQAKTIEEKTFSGCTGLVSASFPALTEIPRYVFEGCTSLTTINFPLATAIGYRAFFNTGLTDMTFPMVKSIDAFAFGVWQGDLGYPNLTSVSFPQATAIPDGAFSGCTNLETVNFPQATTIGNGAFARCTSLTSVSFPNVTVICDSDYVHAPSSGAFYQCTNLTSVDFPKVIRIGVIAFNQCLNLTSVSAPLAESIGDWAFLDCIGLSDVSFPNVSDIGTRAFAGCVNLVSINFPRAESIGDYAFNGEDYFGVMAPKGLVSINFPEAKTIGEGAFRGCTGLVNISFPEAKTIGVIAFKGCTGLVSASFPKAQTISGGTINDGGVFENCTSLTTIYFPNLEYIVEDTFYRCTKLNNADFPSVTHVGDYAFYGCGALSQITFHAETPPTLGRWVFSNTHSSLRINVPAGSVSAYKEAANWSTYAAIIFAIE